MWMTYLQEHLTKEAEWKYKIECYLARLTAETRRSWLADAKGVQDKDFFVVFKKQEEIDAENKEERLAKSKQFWLGSLGLLNKKKKK